MYIHDVGNYEQEIVITNIVVTIFYCDKRDRINKIIEI